MKKIMVNLLSLIVSFSLLGSNIVSASYIANNNSNDGIIIASLKKNEELTNKMLTKNPNGYLSNHNINNIAVKIDNGSNTMTLSEDIEIILTGDITYSKDNEEFAGVFEGLLENDFPIIISAIYTDENIFLTITVGYLGQAEMETAFYGTYNEKMQNITNQNLLSLDFEEKLELENYQFDLSQESNTSLSTSAEVEIELKYTEVNTISGYSIARFSVYHQSDVENDNDFNVYAKINTQSTSLQNYLKNNVYTNADYVYALPDTFNFSITGLSDKFTFDYTKINPQSNTSSYDVTIPLYYNGKFAIVQFPVEVGSCDASVSSTYSSNIIVGNGNKATWKMYYLYGWNSTKFDGDHTTDTGMSVYANMKYKSNTIPTSSQTINSTGKVRYIVRTITGEESESPIYYYTSKTFNKNTSINIIE